MGAFAHKADALDDADAIVNGLDLSNWVELTPTLAPELARWYGRGATLVTMLGSGEGSGSSDTFHTVDEAAVDYAERRSAELVGMRVRDDGSVEPTKRPEYSITESTRNMLRSTVRSALETGMSPGALRDEIADSFAFSSARALNISRTELADAHNAGALGTASDRGLNFKEWWLSDSHPDPDMCDENAEDGRIPIDENFSSGDDAPSAHPGCECTLAFFDSAEDNDDVEQVAKGLNSDQEHDDKGRWASGKGQTERQKKDADRMRGYRQKKSIERQQRKAQERARGEIRAEKIKQLESARAESARIALPEGSGAKAQFIGDLSGHIKNLPDAVKRDLVDGGIDKNTGEGQMFTRWEVVGAKSCGETRPEDESMKYAVGYCSGDYAHSIVVGEHWGPTNDWLNGDPQHVLSHEVGHGVDFMARQTVGWGQGVWDNREPSGKTWSGEKAGGDFSAEERKAEVDRFGLSSDPMFKAAVDHDVSNLTGSEKNRFSYWTSPQEMNRGNYHAEAFAEVFADLTEAHQLKSRMSTGELSPRMSRLGALMPRTREHIESLGNRRGWFK